MYNGIGLQTPRGSGSSGHVQKNISANTQFKMQNKEDFLKQLQQKRKNNIPTIRKANPEIVQHQRKRQILIHTIKLRQRLKNEGVDQEQIEKRVKKAQQILRDKLLKGQLQTTAKQTHILTQQKEKQYKKLSKIFGINPDQKVGSAFDFHGMKEARLRKLQDKRQQEKFSCHHQNCKKSYPSKELLDRHLKYKHPTIQSITSGNKEQK